MSVLEPQDEDSNKTSSIPRSKYLEKENFTAQLYVIQLCLSNILNLLLFAKKKKQEMLIFVGPEVLLCHNLTPARLMVYFFFHLCQNWFWHFVIIIRYFICKHHRDIFCHQFIKSWINIDGFGIAPGLSDLITI